MAVSLYFYYRLVTDKKRKFSGYKYPLTTCKLLQNAIRGEKAAINKYERQTKKIEDTAIVAILKRLF